MTGSGFAIAESIVFILMLFCPRNAQTRNQILPFLPPEPESDFRLAPGSFNSKLENLILNHRQTPPIIRSNSPAIHASVRPCILVCVAPAPHSATFRAALKRVPEFGRGGEDI